MVSKLRVEPLFYLSLAAACLLIPFKWLAAWITAVCVHEMCHVLMLKVLGCGIQKIVITPTGAVIETESMPVYKEFLSAVAGPAGSFSLLLLSRWMPLVAICGFIHGGYNLLPLYPMDGGRAAGSLFSMFFNERMTDRLLRFLWWGVVIGFFVLGLYCLFFLSLGPLPLMFAVLLLVRTGKIPCKTFCKQVQ